MTNPMMLRAGAAVLYDVNLNDGAVCCRWMLLARRCSLAFQESTAHGNTDVIARSSRPAKSPLRLSSQRFVKASFGQWCAASPSMQPLGPPCVLAAHNHDLHPLVRPGCVRAIEVFQKEDYLGCSRLHLTCVVWILPFSFSRRFLLPVWMS